MSASDDDDACCCICLEKINTGDAHVLVCGHSFHQTCIFDYINYNRARSIAVIKCPLCNAPIPSEVVVPLDSHQQPGRPCLRLFCVKLTAVTSIMFALLVICLVIFIISENISSSHSEKKESSNPAKRGLLVLDLLR